MQKDILKQITIGFWKEVRKKRKRYIFSAAAPQRVSVKLSSLRCPTSLTPANFSIAPSVAQHGKTLSEGKFIKETLLKLF